MKTIKQMQTILQDIGLKKIYKPQCEPETDTILIMTRKPAKIIDGKLFGHEIALSGSEFKIWTSQKKKANALAIKHGLKVRLLDGEAELMVTASLADEILPLFNAKTKQELSLKQLEVLKSGRKPFPITRISRLRRGQEGVTDMKQVKAIPGPLNAEQTAETCDLSGIRQVED